MNIATIIPMLGPKILPVAPGQVQHGAQLYYLTQAYREEGTKRTAPTRVKSTLLVTTSYLLAIEKVSSTFGRLRRNCLQAKDRHANRQTQDAVPGAGSKRVRRHQAYVSVSLAGIGAGFGRDGGSNREGADRDIHGMGSGSRATHWLAT